MINNLRDIPTDREVNKRTLAVRLGDARTRWFYVLLIVCAFALVVDAGFHRRWALLGLIAVPFAVQPVRSVLRGAAGHDLIAVLGSTGRLQLAFGLFTTIGLAIR